LRRISGLAATAYVNSQQVEGYKDGYAPFSYDITSYLNGDFTELIIQAYSSAPSARRARMRIRW
jgi:hypothetical protein